MKLRRESEKNLLQQIEDWKLALEKKGFTHYSNTTVLTNGVTLKDTGSPCEIRRTVPRKKPYWPNVIRINPEKVLSRNFFQLAECNVISLITTRLGNESQLL